MLVAVVHGVGWHGGREEVGTGTVVAGFDFLVAPMVTAWCAFKFLAATVSVSAAASGSSPAAWATQPIHPTAITGG